MNMNNDRSKNISNDYCRKVFSCHLLYLIIEESKLAAAINLTFLSDEHEMHRN